MTEPLTILFAGGGSGGHLFPGIAVADALRIKQPDARCVFVGSGREIESTILARTDYEHRTIRAMPSTGLRRNPFRFAIGYWRAARAAKKLIREAAPNVVVGLGGFASVPIVSAAASARVPILLLEQNTVAGRATRWLSRRANAICFAFRDAMDDLHLSVPIHVTGNPVRSEFAELAAAKLAGRGDGPRTIVVLGGSQGAREVNRLVREVVEQEEADLLAGWHVVHQTGPDDEQEIRSAYERCDIESTVSVFFDDSFNVLRHANIVIARAGATTLAELACTGVPAILIPYPNAIHDHQQRNAEYFTVRGAARIVEQGPQAASAIATILRDLIGDEPNRVTMAGAMRTLAVPHAANDVCDILLSLAG